MKASEELRVRAALRACPAEVAGAVGSLLADLERQLQPYVADESLGGDTKMQLTGKLCGVWLVQERWEQLSTRDEAREKELLRAVESGRVES